MKLTLNLKTKKAPKVGVEMIEILSVLEYIEIVTGKIIIIKTVEAKEKLLEILLKTPDIDIDDGYDAINKIVVVSDSDEKNVLEMSFDEIYNGTYDSLIDHELYDYYDAKLKYTVTAGDYLSLTHFSDKMDFLFIWLGIDFNRPQKQKYHLVEFIDEIRVYKDSMDEEED